MHSLRSCYLNRSDAQHGEEVEVDIWRIEACKNFTISFMKKHCCFPVLCFVAAPLLNSKSPGECLPVSPYVFCICMVVAYVNEKSQERGSHALSQPVRSHKITR